MESVLREAAKNEGAFPAARETGQSGRGRFRSILLQVEGGGVAVFGIVGVGLAADLDQERLPTKAGEGTAKVP